MEPLVFDASEIKNSARSTHFQACHLRTMTSASIYLTSIRQCFLVRCLILLTTIPALSGAFHLECRKRFPNSPLMLSSVSTGSARDLLYQDQQNAMLRRALVEEEILRSGNKLEELKASTMRIPAQKAGTGFATKGQSPLERLADAQAKIIRKEGVLRIDAALSPGAADRLREHVLEQQRIAADRTARDAGISQAYYGVENQRQHRCDLQLSLLRGGYAADRGGDVGAVASHPLADALQELLGKDGSLRYVYENLVTLEGEFYELASVITDPGSLRQQIHPDLPFKEVAPLYVIFLALQDVDEAMGPTTFLLRTHTKKQNDMFNDQSKKDEQLRKAQPRTATLKKGDAVLFDARVLHCGNANDAERGSTRALFNFSFRNPKVKASLGYEGSIRPGYCGEMSLGDISQVLLEYEDESNKDPFAKYLDGLPKY